MYFSELSQYFLKLEATSSRNTMTEILAELFKKSGSSEIRELCYLLQGRVEPLYEPIEFGMAEKFVIRAIGYAYDVDLQKVLTIFKRVGDLGKAAENCYHVPLPFGTTQGGHGSRMRELSVSNVYTKFYDIARTSGKGSQGKKVQLLAEILRSVEALSARYVVRILLDKLRLGFSDMTILDGLSWMLAGDKSLREKLEAVYNVRPDIGLLAQSLEKEGAGGFAKIKAKVSAPILASLCQRLPSADEMIEKMGTVAVEPKWDGVRVQIHFKRDGFRIVHLPVQTFSRNLENTTNMFPELQDIGKHINADEAILDSEAVGIDPKTGRIVSFQETTTRKRKHDIEQALKKLPLKFFTFDILLKNGQELLSVPLKERRKILLATVKPGGVLAISPQIMTSNAQDIIVYHDEQLKKGLEGVVVKKWESPYEPGRRGYSWVKFKEEEGKTGKLTDTIDAVVMGYYRGEGKRSGFGIGAFLVGVKRDESFVTITKIGTGVSDELWKDLREQLNKLKVKDKPKEYADVDKIFTPDVWVHPGLVVEVAGDDLTRSRTHGAGIAVRFPRLVKIRADKSPRDANTIDEVKKMYAKQSS